MQPRKQCPDCTEGFKTEGFESGMLDRRHFIAATAAAAAISVTPVAARAEEAAKPTTENLVEKLHESLRSDQKSKICFPWDHTDGRRGLLRTHVSNNWQITDKALNVGGEFYSADQRDMIEAIFYSLYNPEWHDRIRKQLQDDAGGYGKQQTIALFGEPGNGKFEFVMTGRHLTIRCDGNSTDHMAFGGPIFYGHAAKGANEAADHPGNVYWPQALKANELFAMLDGKQQKLALLEDSPSESDVPFRGPNAKLPGIPVSELSSDQKDVVKSMLKMLLEPYRTSDQQEARADIEKQGGLEKCALSFYSDDDIGSDKVWDVWRLEGPSFVWHFRGSPHVHVWVNLADDPNVKLNSQG